MHKELQYSSPDPAAFILQIYVVETSRKWSARFCCAEHWGKASVIMGKVGITHTSLVPYKHTRDSLSYAISSPMSPALSFLSTEAHGRTHLFHFSLPGSLSHHCMRWKNHKPNQGNRYERHKQLYLNTLQLSSASLGNTQAERRRPFLGPQGTQKLTTNQTFHLVPKQNNLCEKDMHYSS